MTKHFLLKLLFLLPLSIGALNSASAQIIVEKQNLNERTDLEYIDIAWTRSWGETPVRISAGGDIVYKFLRDEQGKKIEFRTLSAMCNYFYKNGWELSSNTCLDDDNNCISIFKRRKTPLTESNTEGGKTGLEN